MHLNAIANSVVVLWIHPNKFTKCIVYFVFGSVKLYGLCKHSKLMQSNTVLSLRVHLILSELFFCDEIKIIGNITARNSSIIWNIILSIIMFIN